MRVYKFGGASVKDAAGIKNLAKIISEEKENLIIVVSAFGKTTNALEKVLKLWFEGDNSYKEHLDNIYSYHSTIASELFGTARRIPGIVDASFSGLRQYLLKKEKSGNDFEYDQIVSSGEIWSSAIVAEYLKSKNHRAEWIDIRNYLLTDERYRDANILWNDSLPGIKEAFDFGRYNVFVTQGFIGGTQSWNTTTLGREGSDYTAAILGNMLDAESVTVWKDVPGLLNADPKWLSETEKLEEMSYREAVEMTFSGAKVIHPKTIKPLHNKNIPLWVKSFISPDEPGTLVTANPALKRIVPVFIRKENQILISFLPRDFSFVMGDNLSWIFHVFMDHGIKVNLVEASAVSIDVCVDVDRPKLDLLLISLKDEFSAVYNEDVELLTIRHYTPEAIARITTGREILLEQRTRSTVRFVVRTA
jgi:aspartate kinase